MGIGAATFVAMFVTAQAASEKRPVPNLLTSRAYARALDGKVTARWGNVPLRKVLAGVTSTWKVAILLDRRIDPTQRITLAVKEMPLKDGIDAIAAKVGARASVVGNVTYLGPAASAARLKSVVDQRESEWRKAATAWTRARRRALIGRPTLHWNDLDRPKDIVKDFAGKFGLTVDGLDKIPHDLWAGSTIPACSAAQGLSLVLVQFDLTFRWKPDGSGIGIVPLPAAKAK